MAHLVVLVSIAVPLGILLVGPRDALLRRLWRGERLRTWNLETAVIAACLAAVVIAAGNRPLEWVGFAALLLAHGRNSVMMRLTEAQANAATPADATHHVECWRWARRYLVLGEVFWATYFVLHESWAGLAGVALFLAYPAWRSWRRR